MSTTAGYHLHFALVLLCIWAGKATAEVQRFTLNQPGSRNVGVWQLTHDPVIRDEANYHNIQCWSPNGRYTCHTHWGGGDEPGGKGSAEVHVVDLKTGDNKLVDKGINPRWANQHNWLFYCHYTGDGKPPYETGTQVIRYDADTGEKAVIAQGIEYPGGTDSTDTWLYGTQRFRGRKPEFVTVRVRNQPGSSLDVVPGVPNRHSYVHPNPRHPVVMMRAKHPEDGPFGTNRVLFDLDGGNVRQGAVMLEEGHVCWRGDGEYLLFGNRQLCGRRWDQPFPSDLETLACGGGGDICPADRTGRYVVTGNLGMADMRSGDTWHVLTPHSFIIYPLVGDNSTLMDIDPKGSPDGTKIHFHSTRDLKDATVARITAYDGRNEPDVIHVDSTAGFPDAGDLGSQWEVIGYQRKTATTFEGLTRRKYETKPEPFAEALVRKVRWLFPLSECVLTGTDKDRAQADAVMLRAGIAEDNPLLYQRQANCYIVVARLPFPPHLREKGDRVELVPGEHHWETAGFRILCDGKPIRDGLFACGDSITLAQPGAYTAVAVEHSGLESPPSLQLEIVKPAKGEVLHDKPEDFSWTKELWRTAGKSVSRQDAMSCTSATLELVHLHDGIIAREQWENGQRKWRVDLNENDKPIRRLEFENGRLKTRTYRTAEGHLASEESYGADGYKIEYTAYDTRESRTGQESYRWQYNRGRPVKKVYRVQWCMKIERRKANASLWLELNMTRLAVVCVAGLLAAWTVAARADSPIQHWVVEDPLYDELITDEKHAFTGESCFIWRHPIDASMNNQFALQYGQRYCVADFLAEFKRHRLMPYLSGVQLEQQGFGWVPKWCRENRLGMVLYSPSHWAGSISVPNQGRFLYEDEAMKDYLDKARKQIASCGDALWGVCMGDETIDLNSKRFLAGVNDPAVRAKYPYFARAAEEVRSQYGFGKYGPPSSPGASEPYNRLAYRRWLVDKAVAAQEQLYRLSCDMPATHAKRPVIISENSSGVLKPHHYSRQAPFVDLVTDQLYAGNNRWRQRFAFKAKVLTDLAGKPLWPCAHVENHAGTYSVEAVNEFLSEAVRMGASGFQLWNHDNMGYKRGTNYTRLCYYGHRERWDQVMDIVDRTRSIGKLKFPKPDSAVFYSNDYCQTVPNCNVPQNEAAFNLLGPAARTWFTYISDIQVLDGKVNLSDWPTIFIPRAIIQRREVSEKFLEYPQDGRTLVAFDPAVFSNGADGSSTAHIREALFGITLKGSTKVGAIRLAKSDLWPGIEDGTTLPITRGARNVLLCEGTEVLATYDHGLPAITLRRHANGGRAVHFAFCLDQAFSEHESWRDFITKFAAGLGITTRQDIWRFRFPLTKSERPAADDETSDCLTGNNMVWWMNEVHALENGAPQRASYRYSLPPDAPAEQFPFEQSIPLDQGDLTDRLTAPKAGNVGLPVNRALEKSEKLSLDDFIVGWSQPEPVSITFDLAQPIKVSRVRVVFTGSLPSLDVQLSREGRHFVNAASVKRIPRAADVPDVRLDFKPTEVRYLRLVIGRRLSDEKLTISEVEVWRK